MKKIALFFLLGAVACSKNESRSASASQQQVLQEPSGSSTLSTAAITFIHPGLLHNVADLARIKAKVAANEQPWKSGYDLLAAHSASSLTYTPKGYTTTVDRGTTDVNRSKFDGDADAVYQQALMWTITANTAYRDKALAILKGWTNANTTFSGSDAQLLVGLQGFKFVNAAEIMRYNNSGQWASADVIKTENWFKNKYWPWLLASGAPTNMLDGNWGMAAVKCQMAIGIFCNDETRYNTAVSNFTTGCASVATNILTTGEESESGRDQIHTQLGLGNMAEAAQCASCQGNDLYSISSNRLLAGFEYTANYNLGNTVAFTPFGTCGHGNYNSISAISRGRYIPIFEMVYNHYKLKGLATTYTGQFAAANRPEGYDIDHPGFGTLLFYK